MRKQVDFIFRQIELNRVEEGKSADDWRLWVKQNYLDQGWEILNTEIAKAEANSVFLGISFVKYENVEVEESETLDGRPRRGRPRKVVEEVAVVTS